MPPATSKANDVDDPSMTPATISDDDDYFPEATDDSEKFHKLLKRGGTRDWSKQNCLGAWGREGGVFGGHGRLGDV